MRRGCASALGRANRSCPSSRAPASPTAGSRLRDDRAEHHGPDENADHLRAKLLCLTRCRRAVERCSRHAETGERGACDDAAPRCWRPLDGDMGKCGDRRNRRRLYRRDDRRVIVTVSPTDHPEAIVELRSTSPVAGRPNPSRGEQTLEPCAATPIPPMISEDRSDDVRRPTPRTTTDVSTCRRAVRSPAATLSSRALGDDDRERVVDDEGADYDGDDRER